MCLKKSKNSVTPTHLQAKQFLIGLAHNMFWGIYISIIMSFDFQW